MGINDGYTYIDQPVSLPTYESIKSPFRNSACAVFFHPHFSFSTTHKIIDSSILGEALDVPTMSSLIFIYYVKDVDKQRKRVVPRKQLPPQAFLTFRAIEFCFS